jgi:hypothetical protein
MNRLQTLLSHSTRAATPGLRDRHWTRLSAELGFPVKADAGFSVTRALQLELPKYLHAIEEVSEYASKVRRCRLKPVFARTD